jgi:hypothetical protein
MTEAEKKIREYLAAIGKRGGLVQPARADQIACKTNSRDPRSQTRRIEGGKTLAPAQPAAG